jgi:hypothetical protein
MRKISGNNLISVGFEGDRNVSINRKQVVNEYNVVFSRCDQEPTIPGKLNSQDSSTVSALILFE